MVGVQSLIAYSSILYSSYIIKMDAYISNVIKASKAVVLAEQEAQKARRHFAQVFALYKQHVNSAATHEQPSTGTLQTSSTNSSSSPLKSTHGHTCTDQVNVEGLTLGTNKGSEVQDQRVYIVHWQPW